uniref:epidermal growth factor receptor kinase substrate 8-like protein 3 isoform X3 n=1 Tax=Gasterosteus aculeatus aculeatus TaxID=481459 RepID=UPI001A9A05C7|nr:epidermal growth factor receptor kinase substrate 8-like protein 3 isoform X3 [Gasterosteus aculeatus aculeatus]XP_040059158.1 epidermal growth factor receptor kinase substrate 8-like protein 3 isoform X3 [Gasterosteus aculeatus aculeatus]
MTPAASRDRSSPSTVFRASRRSFYPRLYSPADDFAFCSHSGFSLDEVSSQFSSVSRPSAKSIYLQRMEYAESVNKMMNTFQYRVEHLFTCDLDGKGLRSVADCVERLKLLDGMGRVWGQNMQLEVRAANLLLTDIETKEELESMAFSDILDLQAVLDSGVFKSLLTVSVRPKGKQTTTVFMFQCEEVRADYVQRDLLGALSRMSSNAGLIAGQQGMKNLHNAAKSNEPKERKLVVDSEPQWMAPDYEENYFLEPELVVPQRGEEEDEVPSPPQSINKEEPRSTSRPYTDLDRNVDILNHVLSDIEIFMAKVTAIVAKNTKKKKKKKKGKAMDGMPPAAEFKVCLHKIKYGFNLVGELNGTIDNPSAPDFVHSLFSTLSFLLSHCADDLPETIVAPLLTPQSIRLLSEEASAEEDKLWQSLGDAWNIPSTKWPEADEDIPTYTLEFSDGWQPPDVTAAPESYEPIRREEHQRPAPSRVDRHPEHPTSTKWTPPRPPPQKSRSDESKLRSMLVTNDFISRNQRELTVRKGETVELLDKSKLWWKVRNSRGEEGFVPNNVLGAPEEMDTANATQHTGGAPVLTKKSRPAEVKAWLEDKGFSKITVRCLGGLSGSMLLGMTREELKTVCPEEGGRVFFQLQAVKSAISF